MILRLLVPATQAEIFSLTAEYRGGSSSSSTSSSPAGTWPPMHRTAELELLWSALGCLADAERAVVIAALRALPALAPAMRRIVARTRRNNSSLTSANDHANGRTLGDSDPRHRSSFTSILSAPIDTSSSAASSHALQRTQQDHQQSGQHQHQPQQQRNLHLQGQLMARAVEAVCALLLSPAFAVRVAAVAALPALGSGASVCERKLPPPPFDCQSLSEPHAQDNHREHTQEHNCVFRPSVRRWMNILYILFSHQSRCV